YKGAVGQNPEWRKRSEFHRYSSHEIRGRARLRNLHDNRLALLAHRGHGSQDKSNARGSGSSWLHLKDGTLARKVPLAIPGGFSSRRRGSLKWDSSCATAQQKQDIRFATPLRAG